MATGINEGQYKHEGASRGHELTGALIVSIACRFRDIFLEGGFQASGAESHVRRSGHDDGPDPIAAQTYMRSDNWHSNESRGHHCEAGEDSK
jgi:hypothetical protein